MKRHGRVAAAAEPAASAASVRGREVSPALVTLLLFGSGACALLYQTTWLRELRLVFGASTPATATVLAIFMGGLGVGSWWLGPPADRDPRPLRRYARLEIAVAALALITPPLLLVVRAIYVGVGGTETLGPVLGTGLRVVLAVLVLGPPCVLMGGTLPAAARAVEVERDASRTRVAWLYGANTLGAVTGTLLATFVLLEQLGARATIGLAAAANVAVGLVALRLGTRAAVAPPDAPAAEAAAGARSAPATFALVVAGLAGLTFFLMEIVWYRMLNPLLGGSTYSFGIILAVALFGVGAGGLAHGAVMRGRRATVGQLALTCAFEALALAAPFALGDRLAVLAVMLRPLGQFAFAGYVLGWAFVAAIVVLPASLVAGFQFPLLLGLLGEGRARVGSHTGAAYSWNTGGAIVGALAGGFVLLPALTAPGVWRLTTVVLAALGASALLVAPRRGRPGAAAVVALAVAACAVICIAWPQGPTAAWRHTGIGAGRIGTDAFGTVNDVTRWLRQKRNAVRWQAEGRESSIGVDQDLGYTLMVGGKSDGNVVEDASTTVMLGLMGGFLHPAPKNALVIGLGTGTSAGWAGVIPGVERVDCVELEPKVFDVARMCSAVNENVMTNPRVHVRAGDGREALLTARRRYDLVVSEPSNPYRAGVASLFTTDFYRAATRCLADGGLFVQWMQVYDADFHTLRTVYATIGEVFPYVETWATLDEDLLLVASMKPIVHSSDDLRARLAREPYRSAFANAWRTTSLEGVMARYVGNAEFTRFLIESGAGPLNTDDRTVLEYDFARKLGGRDHVDPDVLRSLALERREGLPSWGGGGFDANDLMMQRASMHMQERAAPSLPPEGHPMFARVAAMSRYVDGDFEAALHWWREAASPPGDLSELAMAADLLARAGDDGAPPLIEALRAVRPAEADFVLARFRMARRDAAGAATAFESALREYHRDPWTWSLIALRQMPMAAPIAAANPGEPARRILEQLSTPFAVHCANAMRMAERVNVARVIDGDPPGEAAREALDAYGDDVPWTQEFLAGRAACYARLGDPRAARAQQELERFVRDAGPRPPSAAGRPSEP